MNQEQINQILGQLAQNGVQIVRVESNKQVLLDEKYFWRMDKFEGNSNTFRGWFFDLNVAVGSVDKE